jgi:hypothetical protein
VPELKLVQVHLHAVTLPARRRLLHLVLRRPTNSFRSFRGIKYLPPYLVVRPDCEDSRHSRNDHHGLPAHRVLRDIPRHSRQRAAAPAALPGT